ncbi:zinc finger protein 438 isoform X5 [Columba livia]|uniref:zinc finger protein 438 isoform X5 n=1 Tax=Columba livia TaxID=8932 RepID=UPI0031BAAB36
MLASEVWELQCSVLQRHWKVLCATACEYAAEENMQADSMNVLVTIKGHNAESFNFLCRPFLWGVLNPVHIVHTGKHKIAQAETDESSDPPFIFNRGGLPKVVFFCMLILQRNIVSNKVCWVSKTKKLVLERQYPQDFHVCSSPVCTEYLEILDFSTDTEEKEGCSGAQFH